MNYKFGKDTSKQELANILKSWAVNMRKMNGEHAKNVKTIWNTEWRIVYAHARNRDL
jgi:hypothetical protein